MVRGTKHRPAVEVFSDARVNGTPKFFSTGASPTNRKIT